MQQVKPVEFDWTLRERPHVLGVFGCELTLRPNRGRSRHGIEPLQVLHADGSLVVIASNSDADIAARPVDDGVWVGPVADEVAAAEDIVIGAIRGGQRRLQGFPVAVNVAYDEMAQVLGLP